MPGGDGEFLPPVQYQPWWGLIGFGMLLLVAAWYVYLLYSTRASRVPTPIVAQPATGAALAALRSRYLDLIDQTRLAHSKGELQPREAHHQLSLLLRSYVAEREGIQTVQMTLKDLREARLTPLGDAVEKLYPGEFRPDYSGSVAGAVDEAKRLVSSWR